MSQTLTTTDANLSSFFRAPDGSHLTMPFAREISLLECYVAGTNFRADIASVEPALTVGAKFSLRREPGNEHDENAIAIFDENGYHLGYIPKIKNEVLARLLDAGKRLSTKLTAKEWNGSWLKLDIEIFLHD